MRVFIPEQKKLLFLGLDTDYSLDCHSCTDLVELLHFLRSLMLETYFKIELFCCLRLLFFSYDDKDYTN